MAIEIKPSADFFVANEDDLRGNGNTGATALTKTRTASISPDIGYTDDLAAATDTGTSSLIALLKRLLTKFSTSAKAELITSNIDISGVLTSITVADSGSTTVAGQNSQSIITGTPTVGSFVVISPYGDSSFSAKVGGTFVGTLQFERTVDNVSWYPISADVAGTNFNTNQINLIGSFHGNAAVSLGVRLRCLTLTSGSPSVQFSIGSGVNTIRIGNPLRFFDAVSGMVATIKAASTLPVATDTAIVISNRDAIITTCTSSNASVSATSSTVLAANLSRKSAILCNSGNVDIYLRRGSPAVSGQGPLLKANGGSFEISAVALYAGILTAVTVTGASVAGSLSIEEGV